MYTVTISANKQVIIENSSLPPNYNRMYFNLEQIPYLIDALGMAKRYLEGEPGYPSWPIS